jgi:phage-related tail protein
MAFVSNPLGLIITGIAVGAVLLIKYWKPISAFFKKLFEPVVAAFKGVWEWITNLWEKAKNIFNGIKEWISDSWVGKAWNWAFGGDEDKKSKPESAPQIGDAVSDTIINATSATPLPRSNVSTSNMSSVSVSAPITINASPGMSETEIAKQVSRELDFREQVAGRRARGVNYD